MGGCVYTLHSVYPFFVDGHLGYFCLLAIMNNGVMNMSVQICYSANMSSCFQVLM